MKWLLILTTTLVAFSNAKDSCYDDVTGACGVNQSEIKNCNAKFSGYPKKVADLQEYANDYIMKSFDYLLLAANFGTYSKNRPGFEKQFRSLSDKSWNNGIELIKHITMRGVTHNFTSLNPKHQIVPEVSEFNALAAALDSERILAQKAHHIHALYTHHHSNPELGHRDPEIAHFIEEEFIKDQAITIRKLSGYANDLQNLFEDSTDISLSLYLFDEYLHKQ